MASSLKVGIFGSAKTALQIDAVKQLLQYHKMLDKNVYVVSSRHEQINLDNTIFKCSKVKDMPNPVKDSVVVLDNVGKSAVKLFN